MKITKEYLKQIIKEELSKMDEVLSTNYINFNKNDAIAAGITDPKEQESYGRYESRLLAASTTEDINSALAGASSKIRKALIGKYPNKIRTAGISS